MQRRGEKKGSARRGKTKKKGVWGEGEHLAAVIFIRKEVNSLQESNTQRWLLTFSVPQAKREGGIVQGFAACKH